MPFQYFGFHGFRNLADAEIPVAKRQVFFIGPNGQGKTNFLEAVYLCCYGRSFRTNLDNQLPRWGSGEMAVSGVFQDPQDIHNKSTIRIRMSQRKKTISVDGKNLTDRKDLVHRFPCVVFCHDDLEFVKGSPERQRAFFDQSTSLFSPAYLSDLQSYNKILKTRNLLIRHEEWNLIPPYDTQLAYFGRRLIQERRRMTGDFNNSFNPLHRKISGMDGSMTIEYHSGWEGLDEEGILRKLHDRLRADQALRTTTSGPHRDRYGFHLEGKDFIPGASTGQLRLLSLLLRLSQAHLMNACRGRPGILLLDDVLLELDPVKRTLFMDSLPDFDQIFYTFLPGESMISRAGEDILKYRVEEGRFHEESR